MITLAPKEINFEKDFSEQELSSKFVAKNIRAKSWKMVDRVAGSSGNLSARGVCPVCDISLEGKGKNLRPKESSLPCGIGMFRSAEKQCPFEERQQI